ncbi:sulfite exporter TauE/SafE family protein [Zooshikella sp. RANM57]|uniref:sulfite exporter TauE/SafE family protein n=1 Tax=Zooshikella sp. RANM57 TaxID=3425863 RepID=UPI003D6DC48A
MIDFSSYGTAFLLGLLGAGHCLGMCGGLMGALTLSTPSGSLSSFYLVLFNLGRIISYTLAGLLLGSFGWAIQSLGLGAGLRTLAGLLLIAMGLYLANWWRGLTYLEKAGGHLWHYVRPLTQKFMPIKSFKHALILGGLWGWLPCGLVYSSLTWAAATGNTWKAATLMATFGLGTLPIMIASGLFAQQLHRLLNNRGIRQLLGISVILFGCWTIPGPHQAWLMSMTQSLLPNTNTPVTHHMSH